MVVPSRIDGSKKLGRLQLGRLLEVEMGRISCLLLLGTVLISSAAWAEGVSQAEYDKLKKEIDELRLRVDGAQPVAASRTEEVVSNKCGPNETVTSASGKLTIGGLLQVWYYGIQNDNRGYAPGSSNEVVNNDGFGIRRAEIRFTMDIHENVRAVVSLDAAREATSFPTFPSNLGSGVWGDSDVLWSTTALGGNAKADAVRNGTGDANRMLQDAYILFHGILPHHEASTGQMRPHLGYEGSQDDSTLDFVERAMITQPAALRDLGGMVHGTWWEDRFQYWVGSFDGAGTAFQQRQNRGDDNDEKDLVGTILLRPLWKNETWGSIELGYSGLYGTNGEGNGVNSLGHRAGRRTMQYAYLSYRPGGPVRGWWMRGEWGEIRDRFAPGDMTFDPAPFRVQGWYVATGYKLSDSIWADKLNSWLKPVEFVFRYNVMQNLLLPGVGEYNEVDRFKTQVVTAGVNYYIKGNNAKLQFNYNWVMEEENEARGLREVKNDNFVLNFQVAW